MKLRRHFIAAVVAGLLLLPSSAALAEGPDSDPIDVTGPVESAENFDSLKGQLDEAADEQSATDVEDRITAGRDDVILMTPEGEIVAALDYTELEDENGDQGMTPYAISPIYVGCDMSGLTAVNMCVGMTGNKRVGFHGIGRYTISLGKVEAFQAGSRKSGVQVSSNSKWLRGNPGQFVVFTSPTKIKAVERI